jgi:hypothetical protein
MINGAILFKDHEMIPVGNEINVHEWDIVVYQKLVLNIMREFT